MAVRVIGGSRSGVVVAAALLALACGRDGPSGPATTVESLIASKVAVLAVGVATGGQGHGPFDNFLDCPRRGVIDYTNTPTGRRATFTGCDAGDGVVVSGDADLAWTSAGGDRTRITTLVVTGSLVASIDGGAPVSVGPVSVSGIAFTGSATDDPAVERLATSGVQVTAFGATTALDARAAPPAVFAPALTIDAIPNPSGSLDALTETDVKRIAFTGAMSLAALLLDETLEVQRGDHTHQLACGTTAVDADLVTMLVHLDNIWTACPIDRGLRATGTFTQDWTRFGSNTGLTMVMTGTLVLGGGVPRISLTRMEWSIDPVPPVAGTLRVSGRLVAGSASRTFSFVVMTDD